MFLCLACKSKEQKKYNTNNSFEVVNNIDTIPATLKNMKQSYLSSFKLFSGVIDGKQLKLYLVKSDEPFDYYEGFYYFDNSMIVRKIFGHESIVIVDTIRNSSITGDVTSIEMEKKWKSKNLIESFTILKDNLSSIPFSEHTYELDKYGFLGWFTDNSFKGYFSYPYFERKTGKPSYGDEGLDTINSNIFYLNEIETPFEYIEERFKFTLEKSTDSIEILASIVFPKTSKYDSLKQLLSKELFFYQGNSFSNIKEIVTKCAVKNLEKNTSVIDNFKKSFNSTKEIKNYLQIQQKLRLNYFDDHIISFEYQNIQKHPLTGSKNFEIQFLNYDISENRFLNAVDVFKDNSFKSVERVIEKSKDMKMLKGNIIFGEGIEKLDISKFFLTKSGLVFRYPPTKEFIRDIYIFIPYTDLENYLEEGFKIKIKQWLK